MIGNIIAGQSGGPTCVINSSLAGIYQAGKDLGCNKVYGMINGVEGLLKGKYVDLSNHIKDQMDLELLKRTPAAYLGSCRYKLPSKEKEIEVYEKIFHLLAQLEVSYFFYIGGNDSMDTINKLTEYGKEIKSSIRFIGIPKTIDNDLECTDHTPGYGSAAKFIATVTSEVILDSQVYDLDSVTILEIMGRNTGWLAGASALASYGDTGGPDLIYLPERVFDFDKLIDDIQKVRKKKKAVVVAISEGIRTQDGKYVCEHVDRIQSSDDFGHIQLSGAGAYLANYIGKKLAIKTRAIEFNTLQRSASHIASRVDITEAYQVGASAVTAAVNKETGKMVVIKRTSNTPYNSAFETCQVTKIANLEKSVPNTYINQEGNYVTKDFIDYVKPLIQGELTPFIVDGIPKHLAPLQK